MFSLQGTVKAMKLQMQGLLPGMEGGECCNPSTWDDGRWR